MKNILSEENIAKVNGGTEAEMKRIMIDIGQLDDIYNAGRSLDDLQMVYEGLQKQIVKEYTAGLITIEEMKDCNSVLIKSYKRVRALYD